MIERGNRVTITNGNPRHGRIPRGQVGLRLREEIELMTRFFTLLACAGSLLLGACIGDSALPVATGKASVRSINAIEASPGISFLIQERSIMDSSENATGGLHKYGCLVTEVVWKTTRC